MTHANGEPQRVTVAAQTTELLRRKELPPEQNRVLKVVENLHDAAVIHSMNGMPAYRVADLFPDGDFFDPLVYHARNIEPPVPRKKETGELRWPSDGHVKIVEKGVEFHEAAVEFRRQQRPNMLHPDPLGLEERSYAFFEDLAVKVRQNHATPKDASAVAVWLSMSDGERRLAIDATIFWAAPQHDLGNLVDGITNWKLLLEPDPRVDVAKIVKFLPQQRYKGAEKAEAAMFASFVDDMKEKLGWSDPFASVVKTLGAEMILRTEFEFDWVRPGENPQRAVITLSILDQVTSMFNASGLRGVIALVNENRVRALTPLPGDELIPGKTDVFNPDGYFGGFVLSRFNNLDKALGKEHGSSFKEYVALLDEFRIAKPEEFARILSVPAESVKEIQDFEQFLRDRMAMQQEAAKIFWPEEGRDQSGRVAFADAFAGWGKEGFERMERICRIYQENFWNPAFTKEEFAQQISAR